MCYEIKVTKYCMEHWTERLSETDETIAINKLLKSLILLSAE